jgi:hypothetical protein
MPGELICEYSAICTREPEWIWMRFYKYPIPICTYEKDFLRALGRSEDEFISLDDGEIDDMPAREWLEAMRME